MNTTLLKKGAIIASITFVLTLLAGCQTAATLTSQISGRPLPRKVAQKMYYKDPAYYGARYTPWGQAWDRYSPQPQPNNTHRAPSGYRRVNQQNQGLVQAQNELTAQELSERVYQNLGKKYRNYPWIHPSEVTGGCSPEKLERFRDQSRFVSRDLDAAMAYKRFLYANSQNSGAALQMDEVRTKQYKYSSGKRDSGYDALGY